MVAPREIPPRSVKARAFRDDVFGESRKFRPMLPPGRPSGTMEVASRFPAHLGFQRTLCRFVFSSVSRSSFRAERKSWGSPKHKASIDRRSVEAGEPQLQPTYSLRDGDGIPCAWLQSRVLGSTRGTVGKRNVPESLPSAKTAKDGPPAPARARASRRDRRLQFTSFYRTLREFLSEGISPFSLDSYLS